MPAVLDHLWQSTLLALVAGLLILAFRKAPAGVRYGLWFAASLKFLVPFVALAALGRLLAPAGLSPAGAAPEAARIAQAVRPLAHFPFAHEAALRTPLAPSATALAAPLAARPPAPVAHLDLGLILLAAWTLGSTVVLIAWAMRWARVRQLVRAAVPLPWPAPMPVLASPSLMEPGLVGLFRPVLVLPETLPGRLTCGEIDAILAHEISHLRRRDNLTAAVHMLVEALFWFHPLVWWIGARLIDERERACDEAVVAAGHDRAAYARSLVESCRLYLQSPLSCVSGASGSNLKARVEAIMTAPPTSPLSPLAKALLLAASAFAFATPVAAGLVASPEGQKAVARATTAVSNVLGAPAMAPAPDSQPTKPIVLARSERVLAPALTVAGLDAPQTALSQEIAAPQAVAPPPPAAAPVQLAVATPPPAHPPAPSAPLAADPANAQKLAASFVQSYAASTRFHTIGRWAMPLCIQVVGLPAQQEMAVRARVAELAATVGLPVQDAGCAPYNVEIGFADDPQAMLDGVRGRKGNLLGDRTSDTRDVKTVSQPIQAWYATNGVLYGSNDTDHLKALVVYQASAADAVQAQVDMGAARGQGGNACCTEAPGPGRAWSAAARQFLNVFVIVDLRKAGSRPLGVITDYAAMLALSQPRGLGQCNALPSITDLFAACPGRPAPDGVTQADAAYLTALYTAPGAVIGESQESHVVKRMAELLVNPAAGAADIDRSRRAFQQAARCQPAGRRIAAGPRFEPDRGC